MRSSSLIIYFDIEYPELNNKKKWVFIVTYPKFQFINIHWVILPFIIVAYNTTNTKTMYIDFIKLKTFANVRIHPILAMFNFNSNEWFRSDYQRGNKTLYKYIYAPFCVTFKANIYWPTTFKSFCDLNV